MEKFSEIEVKHIIVQAQPGGQIERCIREGIQLALKTGIDVLLFHNDNKYEISLSEITNSIWSGDIKKKKR